MKDFINKHVDGFHKNESDDMTEQSENTIRQFDTGALRDTDDHPEKPSYYKALSPIVLREYVKYLGRHRTLPDGSKRDWNNWKRGIPIDVYIDGLLRHVMAVWLLDCGYMAKDNHGIVTIEDSLCGVMFNAMGMLYEILSGNESSNAKTDRDKPVVTAQRTDCCPACEEKIAKAEDGELVTLCGNCLRFRPVPGGH